MTTINYNSSSMTEKSPTLSHLIIQMGLNFTSAITNTTQVPNGTPPSTTVMIVMMFLLSPAPSFPRTSQSPTRTASCNAPNDLEQGKRVCENKKGRVWTWWSSGFGPERSVLESYSKAATSMSSGRSPFGDSSFSTKAYINEELTKLSQDSNGRVNEEHIKSLLRSCVSEYRTVSASVEQVSAEIRVLFPSYVVPSLFPCLPSSCVFCHLSVDLFHHSRSSLS